MTYYDRAGNLIDLDRLVALMEDVPYRVVGKEAVELDDGQVAVVSTVWLGANHNYRDDGPPIIFETMVFGLDDTYQWRYTTEDEAQAGHARVTAALHRAVDKARSKNKGTGWALNIRLERA